MNPLLKEAIGWNTKWFWGSSTTALGTPFLAWNIADKFGYTISPYLSVAIGILIAVLSIFARFVFILIRDHSASVEQIQHRDVIISKHEQTISVLESELVKKQNEIEKGLVKQNIPFKRSTQKNAAYGEAIKILKNVFSHMHHLRKGDQITSEEIAPVMMFMCEKIKDIFEFKSDKIYSVSVKLFLPKTVGEDRSRYEQREVEVMYADDVSAQARAKHYLLPNKLYKDSCYAHIVKRTTDTDSFFYINNDVISDTNYRTSFFETYPYPTEKIRENWPLPYKSELVIPICPIQSKGTIFERRNDVLGFLCVDCNETEGFNPHYDIDMLQGLADGIYDLIPLWRQQNSKNNVDS